MASQPPQQAPQQVSNKDDDDTTGTTITTTKTSLSSSSLSITSSVSIPWAWLKAVNDILTSSPFDDSDITLPVALNSWLYLSDAYSSIFQIKRLYQLKFTHVLSTNHMNRVEEERIRTELEETAAAGSSINPIHYCTVSGHDTPNYDMLGHHWKECYSFLEQVRNNHQSSSSSSNEPGAATAKVVIHCLAGTNRSGLIAAAAMLMLGERDSMDDSSTTCTINSPPSASHPPPTLLEVVQDIKLKRRMVLTNPSFQLQLCMLAAQEGRLGAIPNGYTNDPIDDIDAFCRGELLHW